MSFSWAVCIIKFEWQEGMKGLHPFIAILRVEKAILGHQGYSIILIYSAIYTVNREEDPKGSQE